MVAFSQTDGQPKRKATPCSTADLRKIHRFKKLEFKYYGSVYAVIMKLTKNRMIAEHLCRRVFRLAYQEFDKINDQSSFSIWVHKQAALLSLVSLRSTMR